MTKADKETTENKICLALGFFDCMHKGHREIVKTALACANENGLIPAIFTFDTRKTPVIKGDSKQVYTYNERLSLYADCGVKKVISYPFDEKVKGTSPKDFLDGLIKDHNVDTFVCGDDYTFGKGGKGDVEYLQCYCNENGVNLIVCNQKKYGEEKISTSLVKKTLMLGDMEKANLLLETPYFITGKVVKGRGEGHVFGIPTANVESKSNKLLPKEGVYASIFSVDGKEYKSVTNIGKKPTFSDYTMTVETLIGDFDGDIYGKEVKVSFVRYLRDTQKFDNPFALAERIKNDLKWE